MTTEIIPVDQLPERVVPQRGYVVAESHKLDHGMQLYETPSNTPLCSRRCTVCRNCGRRFSKDEHDVLECPDCDWLRLCRVRVSEPGNYCGHHGGSMSAQVGISHYGFRGGHTMKSLKYLDGHLAQRVREGIENAELLSVREQIGVVWGRWTQLLENVSDGRNLSLFDDLESAWDDLESARRANNEEALLDAYKRIDKVVRRGASLKRNWDEINEQSRLIAELMRTESRLMKDAHQMISVERAQAYLFAMVDSLRMRVQEVLDNDDVAARKLITLVADDYRRIVGERGARASDSAVRSHE